MDIYWLIIILIIGLYPLIKPLKNSKKLYCVIVTILLLCLLGFRDSQTVGIDLVRYSMHYEQMKFNTLWESFSYSDSSPLYYFLCWLYQNIGLSFQFFNLSLAAFEMCIIGKYIYKYSSNPMLSFLTILGLGSYTFLFSGLRQGIAMAILILCFDAMLNKQWLKFSILTLVAIGFHTTAIIILPLFILTRIRFSKLLVLIYFLLLGMVIVFRTQIGYIMTYVYDESYVGHYNSMVSVGGKAIFCLLLTVVFILLCYDRLSQKESIEFYLAHGLILSSIIQVCSSYAYAFTRINLYFMLIIYSISLPYIVNSKVIKKYIAKYQKIVSACILLLCIVVMVYHFNKTVDAELIRDYQLFWE